ncbi:MAG: cyclic nucleotide-binding domain-containing protein [Magnetospirillum sp. WYHS-4]
MGFHRETSYLVETAQGSRWITDSIHRSQAKAVERAQALVSGNSCDGVHVLEEKDGSKPKVVFEATCKRQERPLTITPLDEAALCTVYADVFDFRARRTLGRLLPMYFERENVLPLELLCDYGRLRLLQRNESLWFHALQHVASVQARADGSDAGQRLSALERLGAEVVERARDLSAGADRLQMLENQGLEAALAGLEPPAAAAVLARITGASRDWVGKVERVVDQAERENSPAGWAPLDELAAEILAGRTAVRDLLGSQSDLGKALLAVTRLATGRGQYRDTKSAAARLDAILRRGVFPKTREVLLARVEFALKGVQPLSNEGEQADREAFDRLLAALIGQGGLAGAAGMSEAATLRQRAVGGRDGEDLPAAQGVALILRALPNRAVKLGYLLALGASSFGTRYPAVVLQPLASLLDEVKSVGDLLPAGASPAVLTSIFADLRRHIAHSVLPADIKAWVEHRLTELAAGHQAVGAPPPKVQPQAAAAEEQRAASDRRAFPAGSLLFSQGSVGDEAYLILSGEVEAFVAREDREVRLGIIKRGAIVGEMALVDDGMRMASVRATVDTEVRIIPRDIFRRKLDRLQEADPIMRRLISMFVERLRTQAELPWFE